MPRKYEKVYQLKITLLETEPAVWRLIQVPENYSFFDLHIAIADSMGWLDYHLHEFILYPGTKNQKRAGYPSEFEEDDKDLVIGWETDIQGYFPFNKTCMYCYDFGDDWLHKVTFEGIFERNGPKKYPRCLDGENACPPEDVGGTFGFENFKEAILDSTHEEHEQNMEWSGNKYDALKFLKSKVKFRNPENALENYQAGPCL